MTAAINLPPQDMTILLGVLRAGLSPDVGVFVFGSRVTGKARRYSDLDLALVAQTPLDADMLSRLKDALSESDLTIKVDLLDLCAVDPAFRRIIEAEMVPLDIRAESLGTPGT